MPPKRRASEQPARAVKRARRAKLQEAEQQPATDAPGDLLHGLHFATEHGQRYVELASLMRKVSNKRGANYLKALWRQLGQDEVAPQIEGVQKLQFAAVAACARGSQRLAANLLGFQIVVREIEEEMLHRNKELLASVARTLGGEVRLEPRHKRVPLDDRAAILVVMGDPPRMVLTMLVEAFGVKNARHYVQLQVVPYFKACGVRVEGLSDDGLQQPRLGNLQGSPDDPQPRLDEHMGCAIEDYERAIAARSRGLVRGRTAWNDGRECWLVDFPLVVLVVNRMRTPAARRFRTAALEQSLVLMSGRQDVASSLAKYWREERMARPDNVLLQFMGAAVDHEMALRSEDVASGQDGGAVEARVVRACQDFLSSAVPKLVDALAAKFQEVLAPQARAQQDALAQMQVAASQLSSVRPVINIISSPRGGLDALEHANLDAPEDDGAAVAHNRAHPSHKSASAYAARLRMANLLAAAAPPSCRDALKLEGKDAVKHAVMTNAKLSCTTTTDTGAYRNWILGRFRKKVKNLADVVNRAAEELAEVGLLSEIKDSTRKGRKVQFYRKSPWEELTDAAKSEAERLQIPRSVFE